MFYKALKWGIYYCVVRVGIELLFNEYIGRIKNQFNSVRTTYGRLSIG